MSKWRNFITSKELEDMKVRLEFISMLDYAIGDLEDADSIKAVIRGLRSYYQQKYLIKKEENEREIAKMKEEYEKQNTNRLLEDDA